MVEIWTKKTPKNWNHVKIIGGLDLEQVQNQSQFYNQMGTGRWYKSALEPDPEPPAEISQF